MHKYRIIKTCIALIIVTTLIAPIILQVNALNYGIQTQQVDTAGNAGRDCSIALDSKGYPHISYNNGNQTGLKYAHWNGTSWIIYQVEGGGLTGNDGLLSTIKLDQNDNPHIAYLAIDSTYHAYLRYATCDGQNWITQTVAPAAMWHTSLALDSAGNPHITYDGGACLKYASWDGSKWVIDVIESGVINVNDGLGDYSSLQFDSNGNPCVSYSDKASGLLKYASWTGTKWNIETVDSGATLDMDNSLALDSNNNPLIIYYFKDGLRFAKRTSGGWQIQTIDTVPDNHYLMSFPTILLDSKGTPNICYIDQYRNTAVKYAVLNGTSWKIYGLTTFAHTQNSLAMAIDENNTIHMAQDNGYTMEYLQFNPQSLGTPIPIPEPTPTPIPAPYTKPTSSAGTPVVFDYFWNAGKYSSIALDDKDNSHVSFFDADYGLKYAYCNESTWRVVSVDVSGWHGLYTSIAVDSLGFPHISYYDNWNGALKYAHWNGTQWSNQTVDTNGGAFTSIIIDSSGNPAIAYKTSLDQLKYASWNGANWVIQTVDATGNAEFIALASDSSGKPQISYYDWRNGNLKYARWTGSSWSIQTIDSAGDVGWSTSLKVDSQGNAHISYLDNTNGCLKYAVSTQSGWNIQTLDYVNNIRTRIQNWINATSLALDANGYPHITYFSGVGANLRYAFWNGSAWTIQVADGSFNAGYCSSLALDSEGRAHISYCDEYNLRYICSVNASGFLPNVSANPIPIPIPTPTPSPQPTSTHQPTTSLSTSTSSSSSSTPKPTPTITLTNSKTSSLDITCKNKNITDALTIQVSGQLTVDNTFGVAEAEVTLAYSSDNGVTWKNLPTITTDALGYFSIDSNLPATGVYLIKATWAGNSTYPSVVKTINAILTPTDASNILSITSNSTVSAVSFNSANKTLSFCVNGVDSTTGYIKFYIAKSIVNDPAGLRVYLDGTELPYNIESQGDAWLISFVYHHSSHVVEIAFDTSVSQSGMDLFSYVAIAGVIAVVCLGLYLKLIRPKHSLK